MTEIYLVRHAEAEGNLYRRVQGWYNSLITARGHQQIAALGQRFADVKIDAAYSSDLYRTMATAGAVCNTQNIPLITNPGLREQHMGQWEDRTWGELAQKSPKALAMFNASHPNFRVRGGESLAQVRHRVSTVLRQLVAENPGKTLAVFSHGMAIRIAVAALRGLSIHELNGYPHCDNTGVALLQFEGDMVNVVYENDTSHLDDKLSTFFQQQWWRQEVGSKSDTNLWYRPLNPKSQGQFYYDCRQDAWMTIHGSLLHFDGDGFLRDAKAQVAVDRRALWQVMQGTQVAGVLQLDIGRDAQEGVGGIPFVYLLPQFRGNGCGVQIIGQAVSIYRALGRDRLRLRCAPDNLSAQKFYARQGFIKIGEAQGTRVPLDLLEKYIGYDK